MLAKSLLLLATSLALSTASLPRGVSPEDAQLYTQSESKSFRCITHPSIEIPFSRVNDDFCDCPDGSDEPGTSACAILSHKNISIQGFYCHNNGHTAAYLPLSRVNDGVCDYDLCCDGSDEYNGVGGVKCPSKCAEMGEAARKMAAIRQARRSKGSKARDVLLKKAKTMRKEIEDNISTSKTKIQALELKVAKLQTALKETEEQERSRVITDPKPGSKLEILATTAKDKVQELKEQLKKLKEQRDAAEERLQKTEAILSVLKTDYNPNFNDEGVKTALRAWEQYQADPPIARNTADDTDLQTILDTDDIDWDEMSKEESVAAFHHITQYLPPAAQSWANTQLESLRTLLITNGLLAPPTTSNESPALSSAKSSLTSAESDLQKERTHLETLQNDLSLPLGPSDIFRPLKGSCISKDFGDYTYEYCFLATAHQISRKDHSRISLGSFQDIVTETEGEDKNGETKNLANGVFTAPSNILDEAHIEPLSNVSLKHGKGTRCWNGPERSVTVGLYCAEVLELRSVTETEKCVYKFEVGTPAVCDAPEAGKKEGKGKGEGKGRDEL
ncbi:glucosidase II beta subunit-like-domain-containing protein [Pyronema omphalodes]|nr:glucosidase II beta subunit-like-domain-containing protein [Pyronema omphalodes]